MEWFELFDTFSWSGRFLFFSSKLSLCGFGLDCEIGLRDQRSCFSFFRWMEILKISSEFKSNPIQGRIISRLSWPMTETNGPIKELANKRTAKNNSFNKNVFFWLHAVKRKTFQLLACQTSSTRRKQLLEILNVKMPYFPASNFCNQFFQLQVKTS